MAGDRIDKLYNALKADGTSVPSRDIFRRNMLAPGKTGYNNRLQFFKAMKADGADVGNTYEDFAKSLGLHAVGTPTVNKYRKQLFDSVDPNKSRASELTHRAVNTAKRAMNNVRKPVTAKYVNKEGKPTGEEFAITPAKTVEDLDREYAQEVTKNWENELHDQMADADKDAAKISDMFKSFIGSTDEVGSVWGNMTRGGGIAGTPHSVTTNNGILENTESRQLLAASDYNRKRKELLQLEQDSRNGAIFDDHSFFRGMYDAAKDTGLLTGGASDLINAGSLLSTKQDLDNGVHTEAGDMLMQQAVKNSNAQGQYGDNHGWMYTGGVITTNMAPFMVQIASAGFSKGMSNAIGKVVQGAASKVALGTMKKAAGFASADLAKNIGKFTGLTTKAFGKAIQYGIVGAAQANTVGLGNVANDVMNRYTGQVYQDEQGNYKFGTFDSDGNLVHEGGEDFLTALAKGDVAQTIEFATELAGGGIDAVGTALKNFVTRGGKKIVEKYSMENVSKVIDFLLNNKVSKNVRYLKAGADRTLGKVELNSIVGESLEEELGIIANTVFTGDNKISDLWDEKQQSQIWGGMLLSVGLMKGVVALFHAYNAKQYYSYKHKLDKADANLSQLLGNEKWEELRNQIDATTNKDMPDMINKINRDVALGKNRQPVREYIQNLIIMRGYDIGNMLAAKKAVEDKGNGVSVKNMEKNQAYQQGRDAYGYDTHEIQLDQEDKQKSLAQLLGISEQQLASMNDEELDALSGRDDNIDRAIYDYQLSTARYEGVVDNARDQIDLEVQRAAQAVDMYTDKSRNTIRNATIKATGGLEDYGVYIINGNVATHDDGSIDISNSDDMILYFDPTTNTVEHADAMMFAELGSEENADEVRSQAMADAKEKAIKETTGIIDGVVEVGTQFKTVDTDGIEHTYEVLADNGDGTAMITIDGNVPTELVKGENVNVPVSFEELQKMKDDSDQQRLQAAKAQREQMEKERAEQETQVQTTQAQDSAQDSSTQPAPIEDNLDYSDIIREDGKVQMVDVSDKDGNNLFPEAKDVFYIQGNKIRTKFAYIDANGELKTQSFPTGLLKINTRGEVSVDDYKKYRNTILAAESQAMPESSMIEGNSGEDRGEIEAEPIGTGAFGNIYNQFKGKVKEAFSFLMSHKSGDLLGVFHRDDVGDIDLVWGNEKMGLAHILGKHVGEGKDFETPDDAIAMIENVINSGRVFQDNENRYTLMLDGVGVGIRKSFDGERKNWVVTAVDFNRSQEEKGIVTNPTSTSHGVTEPESAAALNDSNSKDINNSSNGNENNESLTFEDGTPIPVDEKGEVDLSQTDAAHAAEWYDTNLGEDADDWLDGEIKKAKKVLEQAQNKKVTGTKPSELVASKKEKEAAIADAQAHYDSAISIRDALKERQLAKVEDTADGRKELIDKARRKYARLKNSEEWSERPGDLWNETVGKLLHRLYDATGIDVFNDTPNTVYEYVAENVGPYSLNYEGNDNSKGVQQETGLSRSDFAKLGWLAAEGKGMTIDTKVHRLWENRPSNLESADTQEIRNALISLITSGQTAFQARDYILNQRIELAESALEEQLRQEEDAAEAQRAKEEEEKKKAELEKKAEEDKKKAEEENTNENRNVPELSHEQQKAKEEGEKLGFPAVDKEGEPINQNVIELANWAKEQGLEIDPTSKLNSYADLYLMCKDGFGVSTLVPDVGDDINQVFYFPDNVQGEQLSKLQEEFNAGRDLKHSADMNSELTEGAIFYDGDTAREFKEFVDKKVEMQNKVFGEQRPEEDLPFSAKDNGQQQTTSERAADVEKNKVDDMKVVDNIVGQKTRKAFDRLAKMMGAEIQWQYSDKLGNGWIQETTDADGNVHRTIFITLDSSITEGAQFIFGHEMTHQIKNLNPAAYNELTQLVLDTYGSDAFDKAVDETMKRYSDAGFSGRDRDYYAEEVVADAVGEMIRDLNLAHTLAMKMSHPLLAAIHEILQKIKLAFYGTKYSDATKNIIRSIEQAYIKTAKGRVENSETGEDVSFSLRLKSAIEETETNPSDAQKESGNYKKGHIKFGGYDYTIENPKGSTRSGKDSDGKEWKVTMHDTYGYIRGKFGKDGDHLDMFINDKADLDNWDGDVFVVDQVNPDGSFDEHKVMYGYDSMDDAEKAYLANYSKGWKGLGNITGASKTEFDKWLDTSNRKLKPFADYAKVKFSQAQSVSEPRYSLKDIKPVGVGSFGNIYNQFRGNAKAAIEFLKKVRGGEAVGALHHKDIGDIDLVWGKEGTGHSDGYGLSKLVKYHPEVLDNLQEILNDMRVVSSSKNRVNLESETHKAGVRLTWDGERKSWLLTAFKKETSASDKRTDTAATSLEGDTALSQTEGSAAKIDNSSETAKENGEKFSLKDEKTLAGVHNITEEKLRKALKLGGFANPSLAVIDTNKTGHDNFGEISFIAPSALLDKRTGKTAGTWITDAYTQRYPSVEREMSEKGRQKFNDWVDSLEYPSEAKAEIKRQAEDALSNNNAPAWELMYLKEKGIDIKEYDSRIDYRWKEIIRDYPTAEDILSSMQTDPELNEKVTSLAKHAIIHPTWEKVSLEVRRKMYEETGVKASPINPQVRKQTKEIFERDYAPTLLNKDGSPRKKDVKKVVEDIVKEHNDTKKYDFYLSKVKASNYVNKNGLYDDYIRWQENKLDEFGTKNRIFRGYTKDGSRKYVPETLENVSKAMREEADGQTNGSEYTSFGSFIAKLASRVDSTDEMRANKDKLSSNKDKEEFYEKWSEVYYDLAKFLYNDVFYGEQRLHDIVLQSDPKKYAKKEYGITLTPTFMKKLDALKNAVQTELKSAYFETKYNRPLRLNEFAAAVVPDNLGEDVRKGIEDAGLPMYDYDPNKEGDRSRAFNEAINSSDNIRFSLKSMMAKPEGWKQANKKAIHIAEAIERDPKFSLKNLDGTLIKAGTYFSGGGLVEEGLKGIIDPVVAVEYDEKISGVYRNNFGQHIVTADVRDVDPKELVKQIDGEVEYFHASPVCKNYSQAKSNHAEVELDKETAASTAEFINAVKPKVVTIENVKGYKDSDAMKTITDALDANGYTWDADVYNAADYGGYTNRERLIVRAVRDGKLPEKPKKMARKSGWYEAVADIIPTLTEKKNGVAPWMDVRLKADGIDWRNIDKPLYVMGSAYADGKIPHAFADELLPTLRTKSGDVIVMPDGKVYRAMGRVLARVSGVSDDYKMPFSENLSHTIIGNGIPTQLTEHVIAPLLQNTLHPTTPEDGNTKFSLRGSTPYDKQMEEWMEKNHLEKGAVPMEKPIMKEGENIFDYANRMVEWTRNQNLWKTAPKQTGFQDALDKWKADNGLSPDAYPPVRPHREYYSSEIGYAEDLEEYNKKKELWKSAPKPKDFDLSVDLEDMNKQLRNIRRAVLNQKNYDQRTVKAVSDLVRKMLNIGWGDGLSRGKVGNLLSAAKNATGANDVKKYLDKAMGILAENYLNRLSAAYDNLINTKGARADQSGVIKMGSLDAKGQAFMSEYKKAINMDDKSLNNYIANIEEDSAKNEDNVEMNDYRLAGIQAAIMYKQQIGGNDADIAELKKQIGELKNKKDATKEDKDLLKSLEKKLFENKFDRITMYENLLNNIQRMVKESKGRAKEFREEIAEHKNEILHRANLDLEGVDSTYYDTTTAKKKFVNNDLQRAVFSSTYTFEQFLKFFGKHSANGEGRLYNYFHKLNQDALDEEQLYNEMNRNALDEKTKELFGKEKFMKLVGIDGKGMKEMDVEVTDYSNKETGKRTIHLKQGQMLYIYLVNKETDGEMKLRAMGITEEDVAAIEENLDPRVKAMGEWLQDEYLPECQRRYQATHTKYFGAPMKEVENYFPLAINNRARNVKEDVNQDSDAMSQLAGTSTGAIVTRRVNVIPLDIENADAFEVAFNHLQEMEEWSAMLPFRQDINTLLSYTHFRNQVQNMSSVAYGSGKTLWDEFKQTAQIAAGTYKPKVNAGMMDSRIAAAMGGIAVAKISGRLWTAIKQSQSATVFLPECDFTRFVKNGVNPYGSWKWAMENIPDFRKRVENMTYGDVKLRQYLDELEKWHDWTKTISKIGMAPNILVDGITCAVGARSVYETEVNRLTKLGYPKEKAEEKAYYKAVAAYNKTQQSSGGMYLSPMQVDRTYVSAALSLFKNANFAYGRMQIEACRGLARTYDFWGGKHKTTLIESMTRQIMEEDGLDENTARAIAKATYNRTFRQSIGRLINFATLVPVSWALYKVLPYLLTGDDDDK